jgi:hypothetical protein
MITIPDTNYWGQGSELDISAAESFSFVPRTKY